MRWIPALLLWMLLLGGCGRVPEEAANSEPKADPLAEMRRAMDAGQWDRARAFSQQALVATPDDPRVVTEAAKIAAMCGDKGEAAELMVDAVRLDGYPPQRVDFAAHALIDVGRLYDAINLLQQAITSAPDHDALRIKLVYLLCEVQRDDLIEPHYRTVIRNRAFDLPFLVALSDHSRRKYSEPMIQLMLQRHPNDLRVRFGEARNLIEAGDHSAARDLLERILKKHPAFAPAHALLGQALVAEGRTAELDRWLAEAPPRSRRYADHWLTLGDWAADQERHAEASRSYWEAASREPHNSVAWSGLALSLRRLQQSDQSDGSIVDQSDLDAIDGRINNLLRLREGFTRFRYSHHESQNAAVEIARMLGRLGRLWEAEAWTAIATTLNKEPADDLSGLRNKLIRKLRRDPAWRSHQQAPLLAMDLSHLPLPDLSATVVSSIPRVIPTRESSHHLRLSDASKQWDLGTVGAGNNPDDPTRNPLTRTTGAGGGAIDYDLDGLVDAVVMGAGGTMLGHDSLPNELLRNVGERFSLVTELAAVGHRDFGQGVAVGDFNEDGFADLFFANLGSNRLLRNNGDGTFTDCSDLLGDEAAQRWTTCGALVDITGDGITDLLITNYCATSNHPDRPCPNDQGVPGPCHPLRFNAARDQYFAGTPAGKLESQTRRWRPSIAPGRGMGILAGALLDDRIGILIANDMSRNSFLSFAEQRDRPMTESAAARGLAVDARTRPQASMGIASSDLDLDGDLDLYITGFAGEHNIYYEQVAPGCWKDESSKVDMIKPTLNTVGFGTAAIDLDGDGLDELAVTNGHIGKFPDDLSGYEQPFQLFRRGADGKFDLVEDDGWGEYFRSTHVGRALWTLDVDRDLKPDLMITDAREPVRLLVNRGRDSNHRIALRVVATECSRDAVGSVVRFQCNGQTRRLWRLSGDGYMCSDQAVLHAGLGTAERIENVVVTWPDGSIDRFDSLDADTEYLIVQGHPDAFALD